MTVSSAFITSVTFFIILYGPVCETAKSHDRSNSQGCSIASGPEEWAISRSESGACGGRLVISERSEPKTLNPVTATDGSSKQIIGLLMADLIHINRYTQQPEPALAASWTVSSDRLQYTIHLRQGLRFSDGHPLDADDVVFTFAAYLDEKNHSPQRDLLIIGGKPISVAKIDAATVRFTLAQPYAAAERLFDSFSILPRHLLESRANQGVLATAWGLNTPARQIAGLGPFRLKTFVPGQRIVLERNPYYWKRDSSGSRLPYLDEIVALTVGSSSAETARFAAGETDMVSRLSASDFAALERDQTSGKFRLYDLGPGFEYSFLFFNLNSIQPGSDPGLKEAQDWFRQLAFRKAISAVIDRDSIVRLAYRGKAYPLSVQVTPGNKMWLDPRIAAPSRSPERARRILQNAGFSWTATGQLTAPGGAAVQFSIIHSASKPEQGQMAAIIEQDLHSIGIPVTLVPLDFHAFLNRVFTSLNYEAGIIALADGDADPNTGMNVWTSDGTTHVWRLKSSQKPAAWQQEIDTLMKQQQTETSPARRKVMYGRVQELLAVNLPVIFLVSPDILVGAKTNLGNFRPALLPSYTLWNAEELYLRNPQDTHPHL
jgi:peptide/nickel transport system substrate-binding protein